MPHNRSPVTACTVLVAAIFSSSAPAQTVVNAEDPADFLLTMGFFEGGDKISSHVGAGDGVIIGFGGAFNLFASPFDLQVSLNYHNDEFGVSDGNRMERYPLDTLVFFNRGSHRFGAGITYHIDPNYGGNDGEREIGFDNTIGYLIEYNYVFNNRFSIGFRHTQIEYDSDDISDTVDGSNNGIVFGLFL